jgi:Ser/Thr protein kinase RdoA (MazF antagonist)
LTPNLTKQHQATHETPYADLSPEVVLDALEAVGLRGDGRLIQLNSYENRVFQVFLEDGAVVVAKFYRPGRWSDAQILEEHAFATELVTQEIPVAPVLSLVLNIDSCLNSQISLVGNTLAKFNGALGKHRFSVSARLSGRAPELEDPASLEWIGRFIGRIHSVGVLAQFEHRLTLNAVTFGANNRNWLLEQNLIPAESEPAWRQTSQRALEAVVQAFEQAAPSRHLRLHGDCHLGNVLWAADGPHFVDLDDAVMGPAAQDLWMLLSGDRTTMARQLTAILKGYENFMDFDERELRLIEPLRTLRIIHHSAWIARRWQDPAFPIAFTWFKNASYWTEQTAQLQEQIEAMAQLPLFIH